ncbi:MAG: hypothetical protein M3437_19385 [Chloroflexota bacterium]|nr:hypothetical protein [Chloroflexota bacterium]MDQ5864358.1 hypothetical protein [Chloroflexota bacterium]
MNGIGDTFASFSWIYLLGAAYTIYLLSRGWKQLWSPRAGASTRQLAAMIAFFLLVPVGVLLHELGHMVVAQLLGLQVFGLHYFFYWGYVVHASGTEMQNWIVSLAGNFASYALGVACLVLALRLPPKRPAVNIILAQLGILELVQTLIAYPLMSLDPAFEGDWDTIYSLDAPARAAIVLAVHFASLAAFVILLNRNARMRRLLGT